jgi:HK97 family phage major capsid protein
MPQCGCGCGTTFTPTRADQIYAGDAHRQKAFRDRQRKAMPVSTRPMPPEMAAAYGTTADDKMWRFEQARAEGKSMDEAHRAYLGPARPIKPLDPVTLAPGITRLKAWLRTGSIPRNAEGKAALVEDATGLVIVPPDLTVDVIDRAGALGVFRRLVTPTPTDGAKQQVGLLDAAATAWGALETGGAGVDGDVQPEAGPQEITTAELTSLVKIGVDELADADESVRRTLTEVFAAAVALAEDLAFASGSGVGTPKGIALASNIARVPSGQKTTAGASNAPLLADVLGLPWKLPDRYRERASWLLHPTAASKIAALTHASGDALWPCPGNPDPKTGGGLLGWPAYVTAGLPDPATAGTADASVLFADFESAYRITDRRRLTVQALRQRWAEIGIVGMLLRHRVGGDLIRPGAVAAYLM